MLEATPRRNATATGRRRPVAIRLLLVAGLVFFTGASCASADVVLSVAAGGAGQLAAGQTTSPASVTITNASTGPEATLNVTLGAITVVPTCGVFAFIDCPAAAIDPGVLLLHPGTGRGGTACPKLFTTDTVLDAIQDKHEFTQILPMAPVVLGPPGRADATCIIDYTVNVLHVPTLGRVPEGGAFETYQLASASGTASNGTSGTGSGTSPILITRRGVGLIPQAAPAVIAPGAAVHDTVTFTPPNPPTPTGTVLFELFGPGNATCRGDAMFLAFSPIVDGRATSADFTLTTPGTYHFTAHYTGDESNGPTDPIGCSDPNAAVVVTVPAATPLTPLAPPASPPLALPLVATSAPPARTVSFTRSPRTVRVSATGRFSYAITATPKSRGKLSLRSTRRVRIGSRTQLMHVGTKAFTATAAGKATVKLKLSSASLKALKRLRKLKFTVSAVLGGKTFKTTVTLTAPKRT